MTGLGTMDFQQSGIWQEIFGTGVIKWIEMKELAEDDLPVDEKEEIYEEEALYSIEDNSRNPMNAVLNK